MFIWFSNHDQPKHLLKHLKDTWGLPCLDTYVCKYTQQRAKTRKQTGETFSHHLKGEEVSNAGEKWHLKKAEVT